MLVMKLVNTVDITPRVAPSLKPSQNSPPDAEGTTPPISAAAAITVAAINAAARPNVAMVNRIVTTARMIPNTVKAVRRLSRLP
jgi:hypothetical protein